MSISNMVYIFDIQPLIRVFNIIPNAVKVIRGYIRGYIDSYVIKEIAEYDLNLKKAIVEKSGTESDTAPAYSFFSTLAAFTLFFTFLSSLIVLILWYRKTRIIALAKVPKKQE